MTFATLAAEAAAFFETRQRDDGAAFITTRGDSPVWLDDLVRDAHGDFLPDDWRYSAIRDALDFIAEREPDDDDDAQDLAGEFADETVDTYTGARLAWLASNLRRIAYVDDAREKYGADGGIAEQIGMGQYAEAYDVYSSVVSSLATRLVDVAA